MNVQVLNEQKPVLIVTIIAIVIFAILPWVSLDSDMKGVYNSLEDAMQDKSVNNLSGLQLMGDDSFTGTHPDLLMAILVSLVGVAASLFVASVISSYLPIDPYVRFVLGLIITVSVCYILFDLLAGEVGSKTSFATSFSSDDGIVFALVDGEGHDQYFRVTNRENFEV